LVRRPHQLCGSPQDEHDCLLVSITSTFDDLPKKLRRKAVWCEGNEKGLDELIASRNVANCKHASPKPVEDHEKLRRARKELKRAKIRSRDAWWLAQLLNVNVSVLPGKRDSKRPGDIWRTTTRMSKGSTRRRERTFKNVRDMSGQLAKTPDENATHLSDHCQSAFPPTTNPRGNGIIKQMPQLPQQVEWTPPHKSGTYKGHLPPERHRQWSLRNARLCVEKHRVRAGNIRHAPSRHATMLVDENHPRHLVEIPHGCHPEEGRHVPPEEFPIYDGGGFRW
jgi:hypothetical protein